MARLSSRKYYKCKPVTDTRVVPRGCGKNPKTGKMEVHYDMLHPEGTVLVKVIDCESTHFLCRYGGFEHTEDRMAVFDEGHLKRVTRTFVQSCIIKAAGGEVKNAVQHKEDYLKSVTKENQPLKMGL